MSKNWESEGNFIKKLSQLEVDPDYPSWRPTKLQAFQTSVEQVFNAGFSHKHRIEWKEENGQLRMTVVSADWGPISTNLDISWIKSPKVPKDLPQQLLKAYETKFTQKKQRILKNENERLSKGSGN